MLNKVKLTFFRSTHFLVPVIFLLSFLSNISFAQKQESFWCLGSTIIDFQHCDSLYIYPNTVIQSNTESAEGSCTYSDSTGKLLFYSNGYMLWDGSHQIMKNGDGLTTSSIKSTVQAAITIPIPGKPNQYYVFSNDGIPTGTGDGVVYSIVDMSLPGNGTVLNPKGEVISKKEALLSNTTEGMTGTLHGNGKDYWLFVPTTDKSIHTFKITGNGIEKIPTVNNYDSLFSSTSYIYTIKAHIKGNKVSFNYDNGLIIADFNNLTGEFSNFKKLSTGVFYTHSYSPDGHLLYTLKPTPIFPDFFKASAVQYDLTQPDISATEQILSTELSIPADVQVNYNLKNVIIKTGTEIWEIPNPDINGVNCGLNKMYTLPGGGFPPPPPTWIWTSNTILYHSKTENFSLGNDVILCKGKTLSLTANDGINYQWNNNITTQSIVINSEGNYYVSITDSLGCSINSDTIYVSFNDCTSNISLPNIFTPNGDGVNDFFLIDTKGISSITCSIYDRWGTFVHEIQNPLLSWNGENKDGMKVSEGVYYCVVNATDTTNQNITLNGFFQLIREDSK